MLKAFGVEHHEIEVPLRITPDQRVRIEIVEICATGIFAVTGAQPACQHRVRPVQRGIKHRQESVDGGVERAQGDQGQHQDEDSV